MIPYVDSRNLSKGAGRFIRHALELFTSREAERPGAGQSPDPEHLAMLSASIKFASAEVEVLTSAIEQQALRRLFKAALGLAQDTQSDPRWESWQALRFATDPVPELEVLSHLGEGVPYDSGAIPTGSSRKAA